MKLTHASLVGFASLLFTIVCASSVRADHFQQEDFVYKGAFRLPGSAAAYGGAPITFNPSGNSDAGSLLIRGFDLSDQVGEFSIPTPVQSSSYNSLPQATQLRAFASIGGSVYSGYGGGGGQKLINGITLYTAAGRPTKLCWTFMDWYNVTRDDQNTLGCSNPPGQAANPAGLWHPGPHGAEWLSNKTGGYLFQIPTSVATRFGNSDYTLCMGFHRFDGAFGGSRGPTLYCTNPWNGSSLPADSATLPGVQLLRYHGFDDGNRCYGEPSCEFPGYQAPDRWSGGAYISSGTKEAILFAGVKGLGNSVYTPGAGWHAEPYDYRFLLYDVDELAQVAAGQRTPESVVPYAQMTVPAPFGADDTAYLQYGGITYDSIRQRIYVSNQYVGSNGEPAYHVYEIVSEGSPLTPPPGPGNLQAR